MSQIIVRTNDEMKNTLQRIAKQRGQTLTGLIRQILWEYLQKEKGSCYKGEKS